MAVGTSLIVHILLMWSVPMSLPVKPPGQSPIVVSLAGISDAHSQQPEPPGPAVELIDQSEPPPPVTEPAPSKPRPEEIPEPIKAHPKPIARKKPSPQPEPIREPEKKPRPERSARPQPARSQKASAPQSNLDKKTSASTKNSRPGSRPGMEREPVLLPDNPDPVYPRLARRRGQEGKVLIRVSVLSNGRVGSAAVTQSSGYGSLDRAALEAVRKWGFQPAMRAGRTVAATLTIPIIFRLR